MGQSRETMMEAMEVGNRELMGSELYTRLIRCTQPGSAVLLMTMGTDTPGTACTYATRTRARRGRATAVTWYAPMPALGVARADADADTNPWLFPPSSLPAQATRSSRSC